MGSITQKLCGADNNYTIRAVPATLSPSEPAIPVLTASVAITGEVCLCFLVGIRDEETLAYLEVPEPGG